MTYHGITVDEQRIAQFCRRHGIARLSLFGSILREDFSPASDIDVLVEFEDPTPSLLDLGEMQVELTEMLGRFVDLKIWGFMSDRVRQRVERDRSVQYAASRDVGSAAHVLAESEACLRPTRGE